MRNDLEKLHPELVPEWDAERNWPLRPSDVSPGSHKLVWWRCRNGHRWQAMVKSRAGGCGCPVCANRVVEAGQNDLETGYPELARQWDREMNGSLGPRDVVPGSHRRVWWRCARGHRWQAVICSRTLGGTGCPVCSGKMVIAGENDLESQYPGLASEWCAERNGELRPDGVTPSSNRRVWWRCGLGHEWIASVASRVQMRTGCPYCAGRKVLEGFNDLASRFPKLAEQWAMELNGGLKPSEVTTGCSRRVWWRCSEGHVWRAAIYSRTGPKKCGCPICAGVVKEKNSFHIVASRIEAGFYTNAR